MRKSKSNWIIKFPQEVGGENSQRCLLKPPIRFHGWKKRDVPPIFPPMDSWGSLHEPIQKTNAVKWLGCPENVCYERRIFSAPSRPRDLRILDYFSLNIVLLTHKDPGNFKSWVWQCRKSCGTVQWFKNQWFPWDPCMVCTYIWLIFMVNVGKYTIHGAHGVGLNRIFAL